MPSLRDPPLPSPAIATRWRSWSTAAFAAAHEIEVVLHEIDYRFRLLTARPEPLAVDGRQLGHGLPRRPIPQPELSAHLMHPSCGFETLHAVRRLLVARSPTTAAQPTACAIALTSRRSRPGRCGSSFSATA